MMKSMRRALLPAIVLASSAILACRTQRSDLPDASSDAAEGAPKSDAVGGARIVPLPFSVVARFTRRPRIFPLEDGVGVAEELDDRFRFVSLGATKGPRDLTKGLPRREPQSVTYAAGTTDGAWLATHAGLGVRATAHGASWTRPYRSVGPLHEGAWVGLERHETPYGEIELTPSRLVALDAPDASAVVVAVEPTLRLFQLAYLGGDRLCGIGAVVADGTSMAHPEIRAWYRRADGSAFAFALAPGSEAEAVRAFRAPDGVCTIVAPQRARPPDRSPTQTKIYRIVDGVLSPPLEVPGFLFGVSSAIDGALWYVANREARRIRFDRDRLAEESVPLPEDLDGCHLERADEIVAHASDDVWILGACDVPRGHVLLHGGPPGPPLRWP